jgi:hypothetical protein
MASSNQQKPECLGPHNTNTIEESMSPRSVPTKGSFIHFFRPSYVYASRLSGIPIYALLVHTPACLLSSQDSTLSLWFLHVFHVRIAPAHCASRCGDPARSFDELVTDHSFSPCNILTPKRRSVGHEEISRNCPVATLNQVLILLLQLLPLPNQKACLLPREACLLP